ncbi:hypothetical protein PR048_030666 [Dryococelus australis]|uniref:Uncharacterized protein n=1 Tax=Dryococelus australis TaxID=614101 RepID=A0ABQ9GAC2_9NEOP|nr:hypothetical protein PR048_030666 [Dryococelus australis]
MNKAMRPEATLILHKAEDGTTYIQIDLKQVFQKCSFYREQRIPLDAAEFSASSDALSFRRRRLWRSRELACALFAVKFRVQIPIDHDAALHAQPALGITELRPRPRIVKMFCSRTRKILGNSAAKEIFCSKVVYKGRTARLPPRKKPGSISDGVALGFTYVGVMPGDAAGQRFFSGISRFSRPSIPELLRTHFASPSSALKTSMLRAAQISSLTSLTQDALIPDAQTAVQMDGEQQKRHYGSDISTRKFTFSPRNDSKLPQLGYDITLYVFVGVFPVHDTKLSLKVKRGISLRHRTDSNCSFSTVFLARAFPRVRDALGVHDNSSSSRLTGSVRTVTCGGQMRQLEIQSVVASINVAVASSVPAQEKCVRVPEVSKKQRRTEGAGETGDPRSASSGTITTRGDPRATPPGIEPGSSRWEASSLTTAPPRPLSAVMWRGMDCTRHRKRSGAIYRNISAACIAHIDIRNIVIANIVQVDIADPCRTARTLAVATGSRLEQASSLSISVIDQKPSEQTRGLIDSGHELHVCEPSCIASRRPLLAVLPQGTGNARIGAGFCSCTVQTMTSPHLPHVRSERFLFVPPTPRLVTPGCWLRSATSQRADRVENRKWGSRPDDVYRESTQHPLPPVQQLSPPPSTATITSPHHKRKLSPELAVTHGCFPSRSHGPLNDGGTFPRPGSRKPPTSQLAARLSHRVGNNTDVQWRGRYCEISVPVL